MSSGTSLRDLLKNTPKADLHLHLEGTVDYTTLHILAKKNAVSLNTPVTVSGGRSIAPPSDLLLKSHFENGSFRDFISLYVKISECLQRAEDLIFITKRYCEKAVLENVVAAEMYVTPTTLTTLGLPEQELFQGLYESQKIAQKQFGISLSWIFDIVRNSPLSGDVTLDYAAGAKKHGVDVRAIGVAGLEAGYPVTRFAETLQKARAQGFMILIHAGETAGVESIRQSLDAGPPHRIGHSLFCLDDEEVTKAIKNQGIIIESCPCSNIALGVASADNHPLPKLLEASLPVVIASDDPGIFGKTLLDNYLLAASLGVPQDILLSLAEQSVVIAMQTREKDYVL